MAPRAGLAAASRTDRRYRSLRLKGCAESQHTLQWSSPLVVAISTPSRSLGRGLGVPPGSVIATGAPLPPLQRTRWVGENTLVTLAPLTIVASQGEADAICSMLRVEGIECAERMTDSVETRGNWREVLVAESDLASAREFLASAEALGRIHRYARDRFS